MSNHPHAQHEEERMEEHEQQPQQPQPQGQQEEVATTSASTPLNKFSFARPPPLQWNDLVTSISPRSLPTSQHRLPTTTSTNMNMNTNNPSPQQSCGSVSPLSCSSARTEIVTPCLSQQRTPDHHSLPTPPTPPLSGRPSHGHYTPPSVDSSPYAARYRRLILQEVQARQQQQQQLFQQQQQQQQVQPVPFFAPPPPLQLDLNEAMKQDTTMAQQLPPHHHHHHHHKRQRSHCLASLPLDADGETYESLCTTGVTYVTREEAGAPADRSSSSSSTAPKKRRFCTLEQAVLREEAQPPLQDEDARLDIVEEVHFCNVVPLLPKNFLETAFVQQLVPCTVLGAGLSTPSEAEAGGASTSNNDNSASSQDIHSLSCQQHFHQVQQTHLLHVRDIHNGNSNKNASKATTALEGALVEWSGGKVGYTHDTEGLLAEQRTMLDYHYTMAPRPPTKAGETNHRHGDDLVSAVREQLQRLETARLASCHNKCAGPHLQPTPATATTLEMPCRCSRCTQWTPTAITLARPPTAPLLAAYLDDLETTATASHALRPGASTPSLLADRILNELFVVTLQPCGLKVHQTRQVSLHPAFATLCAAAVAALWREKISATTAGGQQRQRVLLLQELERQLPPFMVGLVRQEPDLAEVLGTTSAREEGEETRRRWQEPVRHLLCQLEDEFLDFILNVIQAVAQKRFFMLFEVVLSVSGGHSAAAALHPSGAISSSGGGGGGGSSSALGGGAATSGMEGNGSSAGIGAHHAEAVVSTLRDQLADLTSPAAVLRLLQQSHLLGPALRRQYSRYFDGKAPSLPSAAATTTTPPLPPTAAAAAAAAAVDVEPLSVQGEEGKEAEDGCSSSTPSPPAQAPVQQQEEVADTNTTTDDTNTNNNDNKKPSFLLEVHLLDHSFFALFKSWYLHLSAHTRNASFNWQQQMQQQPLRLVELQQLLRQHAPRETEGEGVSVASLREVFSAPAYYQWLCADTTQLRIQPATTATTTTSMKNNHNRPRHVCVPEPYLEVLLRTAATAQEVFRGRQREVRHQVQRGGGERQLKVLRKLVHETNRKGRSMTARELHNYVEIKEHQ